MYDFIIMNPRLTILAAMLAACGTSFVNKTKQSPDSGAAVPSSADTGDPAGVDDTANPGGDPEPDAPIASSHPRMFFSLSDVPRLQAQIYDFERAEVVTTWDRYVSERRSPSTIPLGEGASPPTTDEGWSELVAPLPSLAMFALFTDDAEIVANSLEWIARVIALDDWSESDVSRAVTLQGICIAYDMLHDKMDPTLRVATRARIIEQAVYLSSTVTDSDPWAVYESHVVHTALLMAGVVTEHDYETSSIWLGQARRFFNRTANQMDIIADGSWPEGPSLASLTLTHAFQSLSIMERHFGLDLEDSPWFHARGDAMLRLAVPGFTGVLAVGDGSDQWKRGPEHQTCFVDAHSDARAATWLREQHLLVETGTSRQHDLWLEFLWCDPSWMPTPPTAASSPTHLFDQWGVATWHSGFSATDSALLFKAGPPVSDAIWQSVRDGDTDAASVGTEHLHPDAGSIAWYPNGQPVLTIGRTTRPKRTALANTYTFQADHAVDPGWSPDDTSEWWSPSTFPHQVGLATNVGQVGEWKFDYGPEESLKDSTAAIHLVDNASGIAVMAGDFGGMYPTEFNTLDGWVDLGLERLNRTIVVLPEHIVLVIDRLDHTTNLVHNAHFTSTTSGFAVSGTTGTLTTPDGQTWAIDALSGGSLSSDQLIQEIDRPSGPWVQRLTVANSRSAGVHHHLYALRSTSQSVTTSGWTATENGIETDVTVYSDGLSSAYTIRVATDATAADREAYLGFSGFISVTPASASEIRF